VSDQLKTKMVKEIKVDLDKCIGCRACEVACSGFHASPPYSSINPARSRIRVVMDLLNDVYVPLRAGDYSAAECAGRNTFKINGKEYSECSFCSVSCPARDLFREPDSGLPLKCDMCESDPNLELPMCVEVCRCGALTYVEKEVIVAVAEEKRRDEVELGLESLVNRFGADRVFDELRKISKH
jgi:benzoyl-CoA reductase subunit BamC